MGVASDLALFCSASMPADDTATSGGAIDLLRRPVFQELGAPAVIEAVSSAAGDTTQTLTVRGRRLDGTVAEEAKTLTGTTAVVFSTLGSVTTVLKAELSATAAGIVTVRGQGGSPPVGAIPIGERGFMAVHREAAAQLGASELFYYKVFVKNTHGADGLVDAELIELLDNLARVDFGLAATKDDTGSVTNRKTAPGGVTFDSLDKFVPGGELAAGEAIGVWLRFAHPAGEATQSSALTLRVQGDF